MLLEYVNVTYTFDKFEMVDTEMFVLIGLLGRF